MLQADRADTIVAIASTTGPGALGIVRISGPAALAVVSQLVDKGSRAKSWSPRPGEVSAATLRPKGFATALPAYLYFWPEGASYTGDSLVEIHTVGSRPVLEAVVESLVASGARLARPGEFTLRAFLCGKMDLTQAEAVLGVVDAWDDQSLEIALRQLAGGIRAQLENLRQSLLELVSLLEAGLDFPDEEDVRPLSHQELLTRLEQIRAKLAAAAQKLQARRAPEEAWAVVLVGPPNAGKSSLFNALLGRQEALVFDLPGTTRDYLTARWFVNEMELTLVDCAGITGEGECALHAVGRGPAESPFDKARQSDPVDQWLHGWDPDRWAQVSARAQLGQARIEIFCVDCSQKPSAIPPVTRAGGRAYRVVAITKADLAWHPEVVELAKRLSEVYPVVVTSSRTGEGLGELEQVVSSILRRELSQAGEVIPTTALRAGSALEEAITAVDRALELNRLGLGEELVATELRVALDALGTITGSVYTEEILDQIFSRFCIGK
ncbi:MAG: 50S ribosome-binding GTPase [Thermoguttaceae bacterium]|nr:50S ribosome-binding GTPase [Thermoguttaceae bacterium]MDW8078354.1 GTPase [Thermoguttaceae bacterium]